MRSDLVRLEVIFGEALAKADASARAAYLSDACGGDLDLLHRVESLLAAHDATGNLLNLPDSHSKDSTVLHTALSEGPGTRIGRYKLLEQIGEGGFGVVFMAEQEEPVRRRVALKIIKLGMDTKQVVARFEAERQALAMMDHPNIAKVLDAGATETGRPFFVMELVRGIPITKFCDQNKLNTIDRLKLFIAICSAVQHAHQKGIIHRDLKPTNVLVTMHDDRPVPKIIDFGIAKATQARLTEKTLFTEFRQMIGTPAYMSPEQAQMSGIDIDTRSDIYSLGVLLYELLTGTTPFASKDLLSAGYAEMQRMIREVEPPPPSTRLSTFDAESRTARASERGSDPKHLSELLRGDLDWIVMRCLEKDRTRRYDTPNSLARDIEHYLADEPVEARRPTRIYRLKKFIRRNKFGVLAGSAVFAALAVGLAASSYFAASASREAAHAKSALTSAEHSRREAEGVNSFFTEEVFGLADPNRYNRAGITLVEAIDIAAAKVDDRFPDDDALRAVVHDRLGKVYSEIDEPNKAVEQLKSAIALRERALGVNDPRTLKSRADLGEALYKASRLAESKQTLESAFVDQTSALGRGDPDRIHTGVCLGVVLMNLRDDHDLEHTEKTYRDALETLGARHPATLDAQSTYAYVLRWRRKLERTVDSDGPGALEMAEPAARGLREVQGDENVRTMYAWYGYAACLRELGRFPEAADEFGQLLAVRYRVLGPVHVDSLFSAWRASESCMLNGDSAAAVAILEDVHSRLSTIETTDKIRRSEPLAQLVKVALTVQQYDLANDFGRGACRMYDSVLTTDGEAGINFEQLADLVNTLVTHPQLANCVPAAVALATKACETTEFKNSDALFCVAAAEFGAGNTAAAEKWFRKILERHPRAIDSRAYLAALRLLAGDPDGYRAQCSIIEKQALASQDPHVRHVLAFSCCLAPNAVDDFALALRAAAERVTVQPHSQDRLSILGILNYRAGEFQQALDPLTKTIAEFQETGSDAPGAAVSARFFLAMTQWQLGDKAAARNSLAKAQSTMDDFVKTSTWDAAALIKLYRGEAEALIRPSPGKTSPVVKDERGK